MYIETEYTVHNLHRLFYLNVTSLCHGALSWGFVMAHGSELMIIVHKIFHRGQLIKLSLFNSSKLVRFVKR